MDNLEFLRAEAAGYAEMANRPWAQEKAAALTAAADELEELRRASSGAAPA